MPGMDGKTAVVTGGATLIGAAVVRGFRAAGANVAVADIDAEAGERLAAELGEGVLFLATDIRDDAAIERFVTATVEAFGGIDFLVNLACSYVDEGFASPRERLARVAERERGQRGDDGAGRPPAPGRPRRRSDRQLHARSRRRSPRPGAGSTRSGRPRSCS